MISVIMNQIPGNVGQYHRTPSNIGPSIPQVMFNRSAGGANLAARRANPGLISRPLGGRRKVRRSKKKRVMTSKPAEDKPSLGGWTLVQEAVIPDTPESPPPTIAPLASDPVDDKSLETATFEELETLYRTIHSELLDLESKEEEKLDEPYSPHSSDDDLLLSLRLEALKSKNSKAQNESVRSPSPMSLDSDYDDKIPIIIPLDSELEQNQPSLDSFTGRDSNNEQGYNPFHAYSSVDENRTDQNLNFSDQAESVLQKPRADDEPDPDLLREQLLKSMLNKKKMVDKTPTNQALITSRTSSPLTVITPRSPAPESMPSPKQPTISAFDSRSKSVPVPKKPSAPPFKVKPMIIYFGDDSSDDDAIKLTEKQPAANASVLASIESMLKEARRESEVVAQPKVTLKKTRHSKVYKSQPVIKPKPNPLALNSIQHLPPEQQLVYMQLRRKLDRQEKLKKLADTETKYAMLKKSIPSKTTKAMLLKCKLNRKQMQVNETQKKCQEAYEAYLAADRLLGKATTELTAIKTEVRNVESEVTADKVSKVKAEQECIKLGTELKGSTYTIPSELTAKDIKEKAKSPVKRKEAPSVSVSPKRKSSRTETISQSQLDTERNRLEEMEGILRHRMEALESINKPAKGPGEKKRKLVDIKKKDKNNDTSVDERNLKELLKRLRPYLEVKELGDVLMPVKWKWNLMTYPPHFEAVDVRIQEPETETDQNLNLHTVQSNKYRSVLSHLHSYRLRNNSQDLVKSAAYANNVQPNEYICRFELSGTVYR
ncbi:hypothetical protein HDE_03974 [Halotydeus destructor]|nr:hypothetical protein HDE_03974 [Halotydeus destructor]